MKKLFAFALTLSILLSTFTVRAEASTFNSEVLSNVNELAVTMQGEDDSTLTIEVIKSSSWEELVNNSKNITSEEDKYISKVINEPQPQTLPAYHDTYYVKSSWGGIPLEKVDYDRLTQKLQSVIDLYNHCHDLQLRVTTKALNEYYMQIDVNSTNLDYIEKAVLRVGQLAHVRLEASTEVVYWESSENFGSGKCGIASISNPYIPDNLVVTVNGVAYLDDDGNIISCYFETPHEISCWQKRMLHISVNGTDLGWVYPTHLTRAE